VRLVHGRRALLNLPGHHSSASIVAEVDDTSTWPKGCTPSGEEYESYNVQPKITCKITDCDNAVHIECDIMTANQLENSLHKLDTLIEALQALREGLIVEHHRLHDRLPEIKAARRAGRYGLHGAENKRSTIMPSGTEDAS
jgi:hypothetical protein